MGSISKCAPVANFCRRTSRASITCNAQCCFTPFGVPLSIRYGPMCKTRVWVRVWHGKCSWNILETNLDLQHVFLPSDFLPYLLRRLTRSATGKHRPNGQCCLGFPFRKPLGCRTWTECGKTTETHVTCVFGLPQTRIYMFCPRGLVHTSGKGQLILSATDPMKRQKRRLGLLLRSKPGSKIKKKCQFSKVLRADADEPCKTNGLCMCQMSVREGATISCNNLLNYRGIRRHIT